MTGFITKIIQAEVHHEMNSSIGSANRPAYSDKVKSNLNNLHNEHYSRVASNGKVYTRYAGTQTELVQNIGDRCGNYTTEHFLVKLKSILMEIFKEVVGKKSVVQEKMIDKAISNNFDTQSEGQRVDNEQVAPEIKKYNTRKKKCDGLQATKEISAKHEVDSLDDGVVSSSDEESDNASIYETVEEKQVCINPTMVLTADDFRKSRKKDTMAKDNSKKKGNSKRKV